MKLILEVNESEKREILKKHGFIKDVLETKNKQKVLKEQTELGGGENLLRAAKEKIVKLPKVVKLEQHLVNQQFYIKRLIMTNQMGISKLVMNYISEVILLLM